MLARTNIKMITKLHKEYGEVNNMSWKEITGGANDPLKRPYLQLHLRAVACHCYIHFSNATIPKYLFTCASQFVRHYKPQ